MDAPRCTICGQYGQLGPGNYWVHIDQYHGGSDYDHRFVVAQSSEWEFSSWKHEPVRAMLRRIEN